MIPYKPKVKWIPGEHKLPGGSFPMPPTAAELCQILPPPQSFNGPFVIVDQLMEAMTKMDLAEEFPGPCIRFSDSNKKNFLSRKKSYRIKFCFLENQRYFKARIFFQK
jgi:cleavage stimulation factor subunit 3